jgi:ABC-type antimicrobial peptide transport system permease subunit
VLTEAAGRSIFGTDKDIIGKLIPAGTNNKYWHQGMQVVGIAKDTRIGSGGLKSSLISDIPVVFLPYDDVGMKLGKVEKNTLLLKHKDLQKLPDNVVYSILEKYPNAINSYTYYSLEKELSRRLNLHSYALISAASFSILAIAIALMGTYGLVNNNVGLRRTEIAIRMMLGANEKIIKKMLLREYLSITFPSIFIIIFITVLANQLAYSLSGIDLFSVNLLIFSSLFISVLVIVATLVPLKKITKSTPMDNFRGE